MVLADRLCCRTRLCLCAASLLLPVALHAQEKRPAGAQPGAAAGASTSGKAPAVSPEGQGGDSKNTDKTASGAPQRLSPLAQSVPPARVFARPRIGLALGGGAALALSEVGVLQWFEENHIPVDVIAGTSMGCMISALYSTGLEPAQLKNVMNDKVFASVFTFSNNYQARSFRRREDAREIPNGLTIGLKHRISFRNALLTDQGLNAFLDRHFLRYDDATDFNSLPIPLRCLATDLNEAQSVTFARGSIPDAVRASVSIPGVFQPVALNGHEYVDGGVLHNLPTSTVHEMQADVVLAVSLPLEPVGKGDLDSLLGVLGRTASVAIEANEREQRKLADVVVMPDIKGFSGNDYLKTIDLAERGHAAAEAHRAELMKYSVSDADWSAYLVHRASLRRGPAGPVLRVRVMAPTNSATMAVERLFAPLVNQPVDTARIEALLDQVRADGRYDADYTVGYETAQQFAAQAAGQAPLAPGTVDAPVATALNQLPPDARTGEATKPNGPETRGAGAANAKPGTGPTSNQPGVAKSAPATPQAPVLADNPNAPGLAATQGLSDRSLADVSARPVILVTVADKKTGPPNLILGANVQAQTSAFTRATLEGILLDQDFGGYGRELRTQFAVGYLTRLNSEYYYPLNNISNPERQVFVAPHGGVLRQPFPIYNNQTRVAVRQLQTFTAGGDLGLSNTRTQELRAGLDYSHTSWTTEIGTDNRPSYFGTSQRAHLTYTFDTQDRALVPQFGLHVQAVAAYRYATTNSVSAPDISLFASVAHRFRFLDPASDSYDKDTHAPRVDKGRNLFLLAVDAGSMFHRNVAEPYRYTLGGPLRLSASAIDQYRGTDYFLLEPALMRRIAQLPQPLGQSFYLGLGAEAAQIYAPTGPPITRVDGYFGVVAETPLGVITLAPAIGTNGERKFVFTLGKVF